MTAGDAHPLTAQQIRRMLLAAFIVYGSIVAYAILCPQPLQPRYYMPDSAWYLTLGKHLLTYHHFSRQTEPPFHWEPYRTPGYPALVAVGMLVTRQDWGVLCLVPFFAVLMVGSVVRLTQEFVEDSRMPAVAGWLTIFLPPCLGWAGYVLTDFVHASLFATASCFTWLALKRMGWTAAVLGSLAWSACQWLRPTVHLAFVVIILTAILQARQRKQILLVLFLLVASSVTPLYLAYRVYLDHGVFSSSLLGQAGLRYYLMSAAEAKATGEDGLAVKTRNQRMDAQLATQLSSSNTTNPLYEVRIEDDIYRIGAISGFAGRLYKIQGAGIRDCLKQHPLHVVRTYLREAGRQLIYPWYSLPMFFWGEISTPMRILMALAYWAFLCLAIVGTFLVAQQRNYSWAWLLWLTFLCLVLTGSLIPGAGSRYRLPGDLLLVPLAARGCVALLTGRQLQRNERFTQQSR